MMRIRLVCSEKLKRTLEEVLRTRGFFVEAVAPVVLIEKGRPLPETGLSLVFDPLCLDELVEFLDGVKQSEGLNDVDVILGKNGEGYEPIKLEEIGYFLAEGNDVYCRTKNGRLEVKKKLYELEKLLASKGFIRIHKSCLLNILTVGEIVPWFGGRLLLKLTGMEEELEVSRSYAQSFKEYIGM
jgi:DNA-binding LytR/AlgR family response regulator